MLQPLWKQYGDFSKKLKIELLYDPVIPCIPMFIVAVFTLAKIWKQPKCPLTYEWVKKMWHTHTMEYYSAIEKNGILPFMWVDLEGIMLSEMSDRDAQTPYDTTYIWNLKKIQ